MIRISDFVYQNQMPRFGIDEWTARRVVTHPDRRSVLSGDAGRMTIARKDAPHGRRLLAIVSEQKHDRWSLDAVLPLPASLPVSESPVEALAALCEAFGAELHVGGLDATLIVDAPLKGPPKRHMRVVQRALARSGRSSTEFAAMARMKRQGPWTHVLLMFVLDLVALAERDTVEGGGRSGLGAAG